jgi:hypothetical protein
MSVMTFTSQSRLDQVESDLGNILENFFRGLDTNQKSILELSHSSLARIPAVNHKIMTSVDPP